MIEYISYTNKILQFIINIAIIWGIFYLIYYYFKIRQLDSVIEDKNKEFEKRRDEIRKKTSLQSFIDRSIEKEEREMTEFTAPLERERKRILSKVPFLK